MSTETPPKADKPVTAPAQESSSLLLLPPLGGITCKLCAGALTPLGDSGVLICGHCDHCAHSFSPHDQFHCATCFPILQSLAAVRRMFPEDPDPESQ